MRSIRMLHHIQEVQHVEPQEDRIFLVCLRNRSTSNTQVFALYRRKLK